MSNAKEKINSKMDAVKSNSGAVNDKAISNMINEKIKKFYEQKK